MSAEPLSLLSRIWIVPTILLAVSFAAPPALSQTRRETRRPPVEQYSLDSLSRRFAQEAARLTAPKLEERKRVRRQFQQRGYSNILYDVVSQDGLGALVSCLRTKLHIELVLPHNQLFIYVPVSRPDPPGSTKMYQTYSFPSPPFAIPLYEDWSFPDDPWTKE